MKFSCKKAVFSSIQRQNCKKTNEKMIFPCEKAVFSSSIRFANEN